MWLVSMLIRAVLIRRVSLVVLISVLVGSLLVAGLLAIGRVAGEPVTTDAVGSVSWQRIWRKTSPAGTHSLRVITPMGLMFARPTPPGVRERQLTAVSTQSFCPGAFTDIVAVGRR